MDISITPDYCKELLQKLEQEANTFRDREAAFRGHDIYMAGKARRKYKDTQALILIVKKQLHTTTFEG